MTDTTTADTSIVDLAIEFHGDFCPGVAMGIQAARVALDALGASRGDKLVAIAETNYCAADGIQVVTGCTFGKASLLWRDWGKQAFTLADRATGRAVRVTPRAAAPESNEDEWWDLADRIGAGSASPEEGARFRELMGQRARRILDTPPDELFEAHEVAVELPPKPWIQRSVRCDACGEPAMAAKMHAAGERRLCGACWDDEAERVRAEVRDRYAAAARSAASGTAGCCGPDVADLFGPSMYAPMEREELPDAAVLASLGCGNPAAVAELAAGQTVLDLGSGGGIDVLLSARRVGPTGRAYGVDMTDEMLDLARANAAAAGAENVEFLKGDIEHVPLPDASVDVVISNCVINLSVDKPAVFAEVYRVLRPGGRVGVSDIVAEDRLSPAERAERGDFASCMAGALSVSEYKAGLAAAGFTDVSLTFTHEVADGLHAAIVRAVKPGGWAPASPGGVRLASTNRRRREDIPAMSHIIGRPNDDLLDIMLGAGADPEQAFIAGPENGTEEAGGAGDPPLGDEPTVPEK